MSDEIWRYLNYFSFVIDYSNRIPTGPSDTQCIENINDMSLETHKGRAQKEGIHLFENISRMRVPCHINKCDPIRAGSVFGASWTNSRCSSPRHKRNRPSPYEHEKMHMRAR